MNIFLKTVAGPYFGTLLNNIKECIIGTHNSIEHMCVYICNIQSEGERERETKRKVGLLIKTLVMNPLRF